ncbi:MAG: nitroreductase [Pseudomonadota bacterium]
MNAVASPAAASPVSAVVEDAQSVYTAIETRFSCRAFLPTPVDRAVIERILIASAHAPSGSNNQPWKVYVVRGASRDELVRKVCDAHDAMHHDPALAVLYKEEYPYYAPEWRSPYIERRRATGIGLYGVLGIGRGEKDKMHAQHQRNFRFFDAPVGLFFTVERGLAQGALVDTATMIQNVMIAARAEGLHTCPQVAWNPYWPIILPHLGAAGEMIVSGMALGYADRDAIVNGYRPKREPLGVFTRWLE